ncbi:hypothetical protein IHE45_08G115300 [Dioscorea alata]|uniref:Uncharacterized protein n=1 Tax=Dioscorea alata TaxID=55571 RepID=A0ACB7VM84_DIOAL|nr:hypothetical protein IHE45_08G115300 [Dioscorea alata]
MAAAATATTTTTVTAVWITPCSLSSRQCTNPKLFSLVANRSRGIIWSPSWNGMKSRTRLRVSQRSGNQQEDNDLLNQDDISYLLKLGAGCTVIALAIKYGSIIFPMITQPNILQALVMISTPVVISVLILIKESLSES